MLKNLFKCVKFIALKDTTCIFGMKSYKIENSKSDESSSESEDTSTSSEAEDLVEDWLFSKSKYVAESSKIEDLKGAESSSQSEDTSASSDEKECYDTGVDSEGRSIILALFHDTISVYNEAFTVLVREGTFDACFTQKKIKKYTSLLDLDHKNVSG